MSFLEGPLFFQLCVFTPLLFVVTNVIVFVVSTLRPRNFPPGPRGIPGLGNLLQIDKKFPFQTYAKFYKARGQDIPVGYKAANNNLVVLNSARLVHDTFDKRGAVFSDRPYLYISKEWVTGEDLKFVLAENAGTWVTRWRKNLTYMLNAAALKKLGPVYEAEAARFLISILDAGDKTKGEGMANILLSYILSIQCLGLCGKRPENLGGDLENIQDLRYAQQDWISLVTPGAGDVLPPFRYLPPALAPWKTKALSVRKGIIERIDRLLEAAREQRAALDAGSPAFETLLAKMLREQREDKDPYFSTSDIGMVAVTVLSAATDTSLAVTSGILLTLASYPEKQQNARKELLEITGGKPPRTEHIPHLKYLEACFYEFLRWRPPAPQAAAHAPPRDEIVEGYRIPKGAAVIANVWNIHHSENDFDNPEDFIPERWIDHQFGMRADTEHDSALLEKQGRRKTYAFGAGRRMCPGMESAKKNLLLGMAKFLWAFEVSPPEGGRIDLSMETGYISDLALRPKDTDVAVTLRKDVSREDVYNHYYDVYKGEAEVMGWENNLYR